MTFLRALGWLMCGVYATIPSFWLVVHPFVHLWRSAQWKLKVLAPLWLAMWIAAWLASAPWRYAVIFNARWTWLISLGLWCVSCAMYTRGGRSFTLHRLVGRHELEPARHEQTLITSGVHGIVRHPIYLGHLCTMLGWAIGTVTVACWALVAVAVITGAVMVPMEERELASRFGGAYEDYRRSVPMIIPRIT